MRRKRPRRRRYTVPFVNLEELIERKLREVGKVSSGPLPWTPQAFDNSAALAARAKLQAIQDRLNSPIVLVDDRQEGRSEIIEELRTPKKN